MVISPDLPLSRLTLRFTEGEYPLPVRHLATDQQVQAVDCSSYVQPGVLVVAASEGVLVVPGAAILSGAIDHLPTRAACADVAAGRRAWRATAIGGDVQLQLDDREGVSMSVVTGRLQPGQATLIMSDVTKTIASGMHKVRLSAGGKTLIHAFEIDTLVKQR
jgi:hypothetical protein